MVQSIERAVSILERLALGPAGVTDLASSVDLPKSTVVRLLATLETRELVERIPNDTRYRLGPGLTALAAGVSFTQKLTALARPHLIALTASLEEASGLSVADGYLVHYVVQVDSDQHVQIRDWTGERIAMHAVSSGQVLLAFSDPEDIAGYLSHPLGTYTPATITQPAALRRRLADVRRRGFAWVFEEFAEGLNSVAAPIRDARGVVVGAIHTHGPGYRFPGERDQAAIAARVVEAADSVSAHLARRTA